MRYFTWKLESVSDILWMIVDFEFQLEQKILIFVTIFKKKYNSGRKHKKMIISIQFFIFEFVQVPVFSLKWQ